MPTSFGFSRMAQRATPLSIGRNISRAYAVIHNELHYTFIRYDNSGLFLCEYVKSPVYADKPMTVDLDVEVKVHCDFSDKRPKLLENWNSRLRFQRQNVVSAKSLKTV